VNVLLRSLRNTQVAVTAKFYAGGSPVDADAAVTVDITRGDGSSFATGQATTHGAGGSGEYTYTLAPQANLDRFTFDFSGAFGGVTQHHPPIILDIVGSLYVPIADLRAQDGLSSTTQFSDQVLAEMRAAFEDLAERHCGQAFVPRYSHEWHWGDGTKLLALRHTPLRRLLSVKVDGVAATTTNWIVESNGLVTRDSGTFSATQRIEVTYEHGQDEPDAELRRAALRAVRRFALGNKSGIPDNAITMTTTEGGFTLGLAGADRPTGDPDVDGTLARLRRASPAGAPLVG
jgi:hypothetical protein